MRNLTRDDWARVVIGAVCVMVMVCGHPILAARVEDVSAVPAVDGWIGGRWLFCFFHANVFHLAGNLVCLGMVRCRWWWWIVGYIVNVLCSFLPCPVWNWSEMRFVSMASCGLSGVLMVMIGMLWGRAIRKVGFKRWLSLVAKWVLLPVAVTGLLPNINVLMHVWGFMGGVIVIEMIDAIERIDAIDIFK